MEKEESNYNLIDWWKKVFLKNYANFNGRARRSEYWYFRLANTVVIALFYIIVIVAELNKDMTLSIVGVSICGVLVLVTIIPSLAVAVRRLHDINRSGWHYFVALIPCIGSIILLVFLFTEGNRFTNRYGPDPKNPQPVTFDFEQKPTE